MRRPKRTASAAARGSPSAIIDVKEEAVDGGVFVREISDHEFQILPRFGPFFLPNQQLPQIDSRLEIVWIAREAILHGGVGVFQIPGPKKYFARACA